MNFRRFPARPRRAGFTLIELLAVILIISILAVALIPMIPTVLGTAETTACSKNLQGIYAGITNYKIKYQRLPRESGVKFFAELYKMKAMENSKTNAERLICPGVDRGALAIGDIPWEEWWTDLEQIDGGWSSYAGRDCKNHPLRRLSGTQPLVADDNDFDENNHGTTTNVLYGNGSVQTFETELLKEEGLMMEDEVRLVVGPDSPVEDLQKFTLD